MAHLSSKDLLLEYRHELPRVPELAATPLTPKDHAAEEQQVGDI